MRHPAGDEKTVLVAEDDRWLRFVLAELLVDEGYRVLEADTGAEALRLARSYGPDVILLDLTLPARPGLSVLRELRADDRTAAVHIIVISGDAAGATRTMMTGRAQRVDDVIEKPVDIGHLFEQVQRAARA